MLLGLTAEDACAAIQVVQTLKFPLHTLLHVTHHVIDHVIKLLVVREGPLNGA